MRGMQGPPGPAGKLGVAGIRGNTGPAGKRGSQGVRGRMAHSGPDGPLPASSARADLLDGVRGHIEEIHHELVVHIKRMAQLQEQLDEVRGAIRQLTGSAEPT